jgi:uncharacterized protein (TIGR02246 family)
VFERFTEKARRVVFFARYEACDSGSQIIEMDHLILGMLREAPGLFVAQDGTPKRTAIEAKIRLRLTKGPRISVSIDIPLSTECKQLMGRAVDEAGRWGSRHVDVEHFVGAMLRQRDSSAARLLEEAGITAENFITSQSATAAAGLATAESLKKALHQVFKAMEFLWNEQESFGFASLFTATGQLIDVAGAVWNGQQAIPEAIYAFDRLAMEFVTIKMKDDFHQLIGDRHALSRVTWDVELRESGRKVGSVLSSFVSESTEAGWKIVLAHNTRIEG